MICGSYTSKLAPFRVNLLFGLPYIVDCCILRSRSYYCCYSKSMSPSFFLTTIWVVAVLLPSGR